MNAAKPTAENRQSGHTVTTETLADVLTAIIHRRHMDMLRVTNTELITLYWNIGRELIRAAQQLPEPDRDSLANWLQASYGPLLDETAIRQMKEFSIAFPDAAAVKKLAPFVSLEQISGWLAAGNPAQTFPDTPILINYFDKPYLDSLRILLTVPADSGPSRIMFSSPPATVTEDLYKQIETMITTFRQRLNRWLNSFTTLTFGETGKTILDEINKAGTGRDSADLIRSTANVLTSACGENFNEQQLLRSIEFAAAFDAVDAAEVAALVNWNQLIDLLPLADPHVILFYAKLAARYKLTNDELAIEVSADRYNEAKTYRDTELAELLERVEPTITTQTYRKRNSVEEVRHIDISVMESLSVADVFSNPFFPLLRGQ